MLRHTLLTMIICSIATSWTARAALADACCITLGACIDDCGFVCPASGVCIPGASCSDGVCFDQACCFGFECIITDVVDCISQGGEPQGPATTCPLACGDDPTEACCTLEGQCLTMSAIDCIDGFGIPQGMGSSCDADPCADEQACCGKGSSCTDLPPFFCEFIEGEPQGPGTVCEPATCGDTEACCIDGIECSDLPPAGCSKQGGTPQGPGSVCLFEPCIPTEACCRPTGCSQSIPAICVEINGEPQGPGSTCDDVVCNQCPPGNISLMNVSDGMIDARQPHPVDDPTGWQGIDVIVVAGPPQIPPACWTLCETDELGVIPNNILQVIEDNGTYTLRLERIITPGAVTSLSYDRTPFATLIAHPGNVNGDSTAGAVDILALIDCLNDVDPARNCPWGDASQDIDRSGAFAPADILGLIDLLNGAGAYDAWLGTSLPQNTACP